jgi:hypothetical protein
MPYKRLIRMYCERKSRLAELVSDDTIDLRPERISSIKGAIDEIDLFINVLNQHQSMLTEQHITPNNSELLATT